MCVYCSTTGLPQINTTKNDRSETLYPHLCYGSFMEDVRGTEAVKTTVRTEAADTPPIRGGLSVLILGFLDPTDQVIRGLRAFSMLLREGTYQLSVSRSGTIWLEPESDSFNDEIVAQVVIGPLPSKEE